MHPSPNGTSRSASPPPPMMAPPAHQIGGSKDRSHATSRCKPSPSQFTTDRSPAPCALLAHRLDAQTSSTELPLPVPEMAGVGEACFGGGAAGGVSSFGSTPYAVARARSSSRYNSESSWGFVTCHIWKPLSDPSRRRSEGGMACNGAGRERVSRPADAPVPHRG
mgnify:CR=1 FL=1